MSDVCLSDVCLSVSVSPTKGMVVANRNAHYVSRSPFVLESRQLFVSDEYQCRTVLDRHQPATV